MTPLRRPAVVCHMEGGLLRSSSTFPFFMVVAIEAGSLFRGLLLLLLYPLLLLLSEGTRIRAMAFISFCGISVSSFRAGAAVLPKHLTDEIGREGFEILMMGKKKVCVSRMPKVMVEEFLRKHLGVEVVVAREMKVALGFYTGFMEDKKAEQEVLLEKELSQGGGAALGVCGEASGPLHPLFYRCKEIMVTTEASKAAWQHLPGTDLPEPLVFHDGRLAFRPTPCAAIAMFVWLPFGCILVFLRATLFLLLPYGISTAAVAATGMKNRVVPSPFYPAPAAPASRLFICNHRTLLDPIYIAGVLGRNLTSVAYGVSAVSQFLSPIKTVMLTRTKVKDGAMISAELEKGDVVVCPEGTTCREPFLLRFSPLFAELAVEVQPVALSSGASMFYGTTAGGAKVLDPFFVLINPYTYYASEFLQSVPAARGRVGKDTANKVQEAIAEALGFTCTRLTRKDKYLALAGNDGVAAQHRAP